MIKYLLTSFFLVLLFACSGQDSEHYYQTHPQALHEAIKNCPARQPASISCDKLADIGVKLNELAFQLQINPQGFGKKILALQEILAKQQAALKTKPDQEGLKENITKNEQLLAEYLAIVKWLESPES